MLMVSVLEPRMDVQEFQEPLVLELICSRTMVHELQLFKNNSPRTSSVEELQFKAYIRSRTIQVHEPKFLEFENCS